MHNWYDCGDQNGYYHQKHNYKQIKSNNKMKNILARAARRPKAINVAFNTSTGKPVAQIYQQYVVDHEQAGSIKATSLSSTLGSQYPIDTAVSIPRHYHLLENNKPQTEWQQILMAQTSNCTKTRLLFNANPCHLIHSKRAFTRNHLQLNIYKGLAEPHRILTESNPDTYIGVEELVFSQELFLFNDDQISGDVAEYLECLEQSEQEQKIEAIEHKINELYSEIEPSRFANRLHSDYSVAKNLAQVIYETVAYEEQRGDDTVIEMLFVGLNEYGLRNMLAHLLTLQQIKDIFMKSLQYAKLMMNRSPGYSKTPSSPGYSNGNSGYSYEELGREMIYLEHYEKLQQIENGEILRKVKDIGAWDLQEGEKVRTMLVATQPTVTTLCHPEHYKFEIVHDLHQFNLERKILKNQPTGESSSNNDYVKLQKHAILDVMLGKLWLSKCTNKKFPFLSEKYQELSQADRDNVDTIFRNHYVRYLGAKQVFFKQHIHPN